MNSLITTSSRMKIEARFHLANNFVIAVNNHSIPVINNDRKPLNNSIKNRIHFNKNPMKTSNEKTCKKNSNRRLNEIID